MGRMCSTHGKEKRECRILVRKSEERTRVSIGKSITRINLNGTGLSGGSALDLSGSE